jgi:hypothetical protein
MFKDLLIQSKWLGMDEPATFTRARPMFGDGTTPTRDDSDRPEEVTVHINEVKG